MKRTISLLLALLMIVTLLPMSVFAEEATPTISVKSAYSMPGSTVDVALRVDNNPGITATSLKMVFDDKLTLVSATNGDAFEALTMTAPAKLNRGEEVTGSCRIAWYSADIETEDIQDGTILTLQFRVAEDAEINEDYLIRIVSDDGATIGKDGNAMPINTENGIVTVIDYMPGDVNGDGRINMKDVVMLSQYIVDDCKYDENGYAVQIKDEAADVNGDGRINMQDVVLISRYIVDGCITDPSGYNVELVPAYKPCKHTLEAVEATAPTCTEDGNIAYWHCTKCDKFFDDVDGKSRIEFEDTVVAALGHDIVVDKGYDPDYGKEGLTEGKHCTRCDYVVAQEVIPALKKDEYAIEYNLFDNNDYLEKSGVENPNPTAYTAEDGLKLKDLKNDGFEFAGWYDANGNKVSEIAKGKTGSVKLYARWTEKTYDITYKLYQTPLAPISDEKYLHYTVSKGLVDLPNPELNNYIFLGWYMDDGAEVTKIPAGTTGDITLNAYWTSKRNLAKAVGKLESPIVCEDVDKNVFYFTYELGTIENVPLSDNIWTIQSVAGLAQQQSKTITTCISNENAEKVAKTIAKETVDSGTWTLSNGWNKVTSVNEEWAKQNGMTREEAETKVKTSEDTYSLTTSNGGNSSHTENGGSTTLKYGSEDVSGSKKTSLNAGYSETNNVDVKIYGETSANVSAGIDGLGVNGGYKIGGEVSSGHEDTFEIGAGIERGGTVANKSGEDTTTYNTTVNSNVSTWNTDKTTSKTVSDSKSSTISQALSEIISNTKKYGESYSSSGEHSEQQAFANTESESNDYVTTFTYSTAETVQKTSTYSTDGKSEGCYRLVLAGTVHVFGVVGYDVASKSYFAFTYNVLDDETYEFLDYSPDLKFNDYENGALPFEVPYEIYEYVTAEIATTEGLHFKTNSSNGTATVTNYDGESAQVVVPSYISSAGTAYKVTAISPNAFAGKDVNAVALGRYIEEIPDGAFKDCKTLEDISGYFTAIGNEAFSGCTKLSNFTVASTVTAIGDNAFEDVAKITVNVINKENAMQVAKMAKPEASDEELAETAKEITQTLIQSAVSSGADEITLNISSIINECALTIDVPEISYFELQGGKKTYSDLKLNSDAETTVISEMTIKDCTRIPFEISSENLTLNTVSVICPGYAMLLSADSVNISLIKDNNIVSQSGRAVVCSNPVIESTNTNGVDGALDVSGDVYYYHSISGEDNVFVTNGDLKEISADEFDKYIKGSINVSFDANGGDEVAETVVAYFGTAIGKLPTPTREYYTFDGWYTEPECRNEITSESVLTSTTDVTLYAHWKINEYTVTLDANGGAFSAEDETSRNVEYMSQVGALPTPTKNYNDFIGWFTKAEGGTEITAESTMEGSDITLYAHWKLKDSVGWALKSKMPEGAELLDTKFVYDLETTDGAKTGYTNKTEKWSAYGSWSSWSKTKATASDSRKIDTRTIAATYKTEYNYSRWTEKDGSNGYGWNGPSQGTYSGHYCGYYFERGWGSQLSVYQSDIPSYGASGNVWYNQKTRQTVVTAAYTEYRYCDRHKIYTYTFESAQKPSGTGVSNVQEYVMYRPK